MLKKPRFLGESVAFDSIFRFLLDDRRKQVIFNFNFHFRSTVLAIAIFLQVELNILFFNVCAGLIYHNLLLGLFMSIP